MNTCLRVRVRMCVCAAPINCVTVPHAHFLWLQARVQTPPISAACSQFLQDDIAKGSVHDNLYVVSYYPVVLIGVGLLQNAAFVFVQLTAG